MIHDKFCWASSLWNPFVENNCRKACVPSPYITTDDELLPHKATCRFIHHVPNKPDKFKMKIWMAVDATTKYLFNSFPYLGNDESMDNSLDLPKCVATKLMQLIFKRVNNVTCDNFFTSLDIALHQVDQKCSIVGPVGQNQTELPEAVKSSGTTKLPCLHLLKQLLLL